MTTEHYFSSTKKHPAEYSGWRVESGFAVDSDREVKVGFSEYDNQWSDHREALKLEDTGNGLRVKLFKGNERGEEREFYLNYLDAETVLLALIKYHEPKGLTFRKMGDELIKIGP
jgi:hypothetical protein